MFACVHVHKNIPIAICKYNIRLFAYTQTHQQNIRKMVEDKDNQITKLASDLKSKEEEIGQLKHNDEIKMVNFMCLITISIN